MPKNIDDIIVPEKRRSIRNIPIPEGRRRTDKQPVQPDAPFTMKEFYPPVTPPPPPRSASAYDDLPPRQEEKKFPKISRGSRMPKKGLWIGIGAALLIGIFVLLTIFNGSTLAYVPKSQSVSFDNDVYTAEKAGEGKLFYSVVKLSKDKGLDATATGEAEVSRKASGTIIVYNDATTEPQRLIATTRFETPNGLVYRIPEGIVIPGKKTVAGVSQPGSIETIVYADEAGVKYNVGLTDFTVPGLKGGARYTTIYARSKTEMSRGFVGMEKSVSTQDEAKVKSDLEAALRAELTSEARAQVPEDFVLFASLSSVAFESLPQTVSAVAGKATVNMRGNLYGVMFKRSDLSNHLAQNKITLAVGESVVITNLDSLDLSFVETSPVDLLLSDDIKFAVNGQATAVWRTDEVALKSDLLGKHKRDIPSILNNYPTVTSATATIRPFWNANFPDDSADISIKQLPVN